MATPPLSVEEQLRQAEQRELSLARRVAQFNDMVQDLRQRNDKLQAELMEVKTIGSSSLESVQRKAREEMQKLADALTQRHDELEEAQRRESALTVQVQSLSKQVRAI